MDQIDTINQMGFFNGSTFENPIMRVTIAQLEAFFWSVQFGLARQAADHLHIAQPTISLRLKDLRDSLDTVLLERTARGLRPTEAGRALLPRANAILIELQQIHGGNIEGEAVGPVRVGLAEGFALTCLPPLLHALLRDHPALQPEWVISTSITLESALLRNTVDIAVLLNPIGDERLHLRPLGAQPTSWVAPFSWKLVGPIRPKDLWSTPVITNAAPAAMHRQIMSWFATAGIEPTRLNFCSSVAVEAELVAGGIGVGLLPKQMATRHIAEGTMVLLASEPLVENGKLFISHRLGMDDLKTRAVAQTIVKVLETFDYLARQ